MIAFERTTNLDVVRAILTDPRIWPHIGDDFAPPVEEFQPNPDARIWYVLAFEDLRVIGLFLFVPRSTVLFEVHISLLKERQTTGTTIVEQVFGWMFEHSTARRIVAEIPESNRLAVRLAARTMRFTCVNEKAFLKHGRLQGLICFGISKGGTECRQ